MVMTRRQLIKAIDKDRIRRAIEDAEQRTSGEICVSISPFFWGNVEGAARKAFDRLGMANTAQRNGVLFLVVPSRRKFVIIGDEGIHQKVGQDFWNHLAAVLSEHFHDGDFTGGLEAAIREAGEQLAVHFPYSADSDVNELPDHVDFGDPSEE